MIKLSKTEIDKAIEKYLGENPQEGDLVTLWDNGKIDEKIAKGTNFKDPDPAN